MNSFLNRPFRISIFFIFFSLSLSPAGSPDSPAYGDTEILFTPENDSSSTTGTSSTADLLSPSSLSIECQWKKGSIFTPDILPEGASPEWQAYVVLILSCKSLGQDFSGLRLNLLGPLVCESSSNDVCIEKSTIPSDIALSSSEYKELGYVLYKNANIDSNESVTVSKGTIGVNLAKDSVTKIDITGDKFEEDLIFRPYGKGLSCDVFVSGVINNSDLQSAQCNTSSSCSPSGSVQVKNGSLVFTAQLKGFEEPFYSTGLGTKVTWSGGPDSSGAWDAVPANEDLVVRAAVFSSVSNSKSKYCSIRFRQQSVLGVLKLNPLGDCEFFRALRNYYFLNPEENNIQTSGFSKDGISLPGIDYQYGKLIPEIPIAGILNSATKKDGKLYSVGIQVGIPPIDIRKYVASVVTASPFEPVRSLTGVIESYKIGDPVAYGVINLANYTNVEMVSIGTKLNDLSPESLVVFQSYVAHSEALNGAEKRGVDGSSLYSFIPEKSGAFDKMIPFVNDACLPNFQFSMPIRPDKINLPEALSSATLCSHSRPEKVVDLKSSRVAATILSIVPLSADHKFPTELVASSPIDSQSSQSLGSSVSSSGGQCWVINPSSFGASSWEEPKYEWESSFKSNTTNVTQVDECSTVNTTSGFGALGYRDNNAAMLFALNFGCAVTLGKSGTLVYAVTPLTRVQTGKTVYTDLEPFEPDKPHYGPVNCYEGKSKIPYINYGLREVISSTREKLTTPSASFTRSSSTYGVRTQRFFVKPPGNYVPTLETHSLAFFDAPLCPGSQFKFDSVVMSWSPLVLDLQGNGIRISRDFKRSVGFYLHNKKHLSYVDWPENTDEVAFLVRPSYKRGLIGLTDLYGDTDALNGFEQLRKHDFNKDGLITRLDKDYEKLRLWFDRNRNAQVDKGELESISKYSVDKIYLTYTKPQAGFEASQRALHSTYWNSKFKKFFNIEDVYVKEYKDNSRLLGENKTK